LIREGKEVKNITLKTEPTSLTFSSKSYSKYAAKDKIITKPIIIFFIG